MVYRAKHVTQWDGSPLAAGNCRMAVAATHLDFHTKGEKTSTGGKMRANQDDQSGGTDSGDAQRAWARGYQEALVIRDGGTWDDLLADREAGRFVSVDVLYSVLSNRCQVASNFGHTIGIAPESRSGLWLVSDPLCGSYKYMDPAQIQKAAEAWGIRVYGQGFSGRTGCGGADTPSRIAPALAGPTERHVSEGSGTRYHSGKTGGPTGLRIRYTTSIEKNAGGEPMIKVEPQQAEVAKSVEYYDAPGGDSVGAMSNPYTLDILGIPMDNSADHINYGWRAAYVDTPAGDGDSATKVVYFLAATLSNIRPKPPVHTPEPTPPGDCTDAIEARDKQWITHLTPPA